MVAWHHYQCANVWLASDAWRGVCGLLDVQSQCRVLRFASHWVSRITAGGGPGCKTFCYNPACLLLASEDGACEITLFQPDRRPLHDPSKEQQKPYDCCTLSMVEERTADGGKQDGAAAEVEELVTCFHRQASARMHVTKGGCYRLVASSWAPGVQGAFWVTVTGSGLTMKQVALREPSAEDAVAMQDQGFTSFCCVVCKDDIKGGYSPGENGPMCRKCV
jgi:hypothetical protein